MSAKGRLAVAAASLPILAVFVFAARPPISGSFEVSQWQRARGTVPRVTIDELTALVRTALADAWEVEGRAREPYGGGWARMRGARLMASGIPQAKWNNADITAADADLEAVSA